MAISDIPNSTHHEKNASTMLSLRICTTPCIDSMYEPPLRGGSSAPKTHHNLQTHAVVVEPLAVLAVLIVAADL